MAFFEDNLLAVNGGLTHHGEQVTADEDLSPSLENTISSSVAAADPPWPTITGQAEVYF